MLINYNRYCTYLYFYSGTSEPSPVLLASIAHYSYFSKRYILVTNIEPSAFPKNISDSIEILPINSIESAETTEACAILQQLWTSEQLKANHPPVELHCFKRWFILRDLYDLGYLAHDELCLSHDWDDLVFLPTQLFTSFLDERITSAGLDISAHILLCAHTAQPVGHYLGPHIMVLNTLAAQEFCSSVSNLVRLHIRQRAHQNFPDMSVWAYVYYNGLIASPCSSYLWADIVPANLFFDDNIRILNPSGLKISARSVHIPKKYSFLPHGQTHLSVKLYDIEGPCSFLRVHLENGNTAAGINIHYSGVEGKYILLQDIKNRFASFYEQRPLLSSLLFT